MDKQGLTYSYLKELIKEYLSGELENKIKRFRLKIRAESDNDVYWPQNISIDTSGIYFSETNEISDPTAATALLICRNYYTQKKYYDFYIKVKQLVDNYNLTESQIKLLELYLSRKRSTPAAKELANDLLDYIYSGVYNMNLLRQAAK